MKFSRTLGVIVLLAAAVGWFAYVLYDLQIVQGADYLAQSTRKISEIQTVEAARGQILDRYGRVLVSNRLSYRVVLDISRMGSAQERNANLLRLLELCELEGAAWTDTLPVSPYEPYYYPASATNTARARLEGFVENRAEAKADYKTALTDASAKELIVWLREYYEIDESYTSRQARQVVGVLYELELRRRQITQLDYIFAEEVSLDFIARVKEESLPGVTTQSTTSRQYHTDYAAHLLGRVGLMDETEWTYYKELGYSMDAVVGKFGVESTFETYLHGTGGTRAVETNQSGKIVSEEYLVEPAPGENVFLTLDIKLQAATEQALAEHMPSFAEGKGAAAVVLDVRDGSTLAMASYPTFDLKRYSLDYNELLAQELKPLMNRATHETYAPGSTYKMVSAVAALETGLITASTRINCTGRYTYYKDAASQPMCWIFRQHGGTHGPETVTEAITDSCNVFFYDVGRRLGIETIGEYAAMFGLGQATGIEIPETLGVVASPAYTESVGQTWYPGNVMYAAVGQENNRFTPLQLASYCATIANGGSHYSVHLLKSVKSSDFRAVVYEHSPDLRDQLTISESAMEAVKKGMLGVTTGSGSAARYFSGLETTVAGKTGSAQIASDLEANAVFIAFAPYENPEIAICVVVEQGGSGSETGVIVADIVEAYFNSAATTDLPAGENKLLR